jgi:hypothetical protein
MASFISLEMASFRPTRSSRLLMAQTLSFHRPAHPLPAAHRSKGNPASLPWSGLPVIGTGRPVPGRGQPTLSARTPSGCPALRVAALTLESGGFTGRFSGRMVSVLPAIVAAVPAVTGHASASLVPALPHPGLLSATGLAPGGLRTTLTRKSGSNRPVAG